MRRKLSFKRGSGDDSLPAIFIAIAVLLCVVIGGGYLVVLVF